MPDEKLKDYHDFYNKAAFTVYTDGENVKHIVGTIFN